MPDPNYATTAHIRLDALRSNARAVRQLIGDRTLLVAVKANAYGHGAVPVAIFLERQQLADWFGVATAPEAIELRDSGVTSPILKMSLSFADELPALLALPDVSLTVADATTIDQAEQAAAAAGVTARVHLAIDTGMRRVGCEPSAAIDLARRVSACRHLDLQGLGTHLPISDQPDDDGFTVDELARFRSVVTQIQADRAVHGLSPVPMVHCANSGAVLSHDLDGFTMVRPGIMIYGYYPDTTTPRPVELTPVMELTSKVTFVKPLAVGQTVGYGRTWTSSKDTWIATVPVGYADGFSRLNSNRGSMLVNGRPYPVAGRVCMDFTMLDLGPGDSPPVTVGDEVCWLGRRGGHSITADDLAGIMGTISYEVLCLIGPRVRRVYSSLGDDATG